MALINKVAPATIIRGIENLTRPGVYRVVNRNYYILRQNDGATDANVLNDYSSSAFPRWSRYGGEYMGSRLSNTFILSPNGTISVVNDTLERWPSMQFEFVADSIDITIPGHA